MFFSLTELERHPIHFDVSYEPGEIEFPVEIRQRGGLRSEGKVELLRNTLGEIRLRGRVDAVVEGDCDRCLEPATVEIHEKFDLFYRPVLNTANHAEIHLAEGEIDISFYEGDGILLREAMREFVLLSLPMRLFCKPDCKGLCPVCGANRNFAECGCRVERADPRWAALKGIE
jgi:uncharacterized protein